MLRNILLVLVTASVGSAEKAWALSVITEPARHVSSSSATLAGQASGEGSYAFWFEWGTNQSYGQRTPMVLDLPAGGSVTTQLTNLAPET